MADVHNHTIQPAAEIDTKDHGQYELKEAEQVDLSAQNSTFDEEEVEPELHARIWITLVAFFMLNYTQVVALQGPSAVVSTSDLRTKSALISI